MCISTHDSLLYAPVQRVQILFLLLLSFIISQFAQLSVLTTECCVFSTKSCKQGLQSNPQLSGNYWDGREKCVFPDQLAKISLQQLSLLADCCGQPYFSRNWLFCKHFPTTLQKVGRLWRVIQTWIQGKSYAFWHVLTVAIRHNL